MKYLITFSLALFSCCQFVIAQDEMEMEMPKPTEHHQLLTDSVGVWDAEISFWMEGPDGPVSKSKGVETVRSIGGFWIASDLKYEFMGAPVQGHGVIGFDPDKKKFVGNWHDSMTPHISSMEGEYDAEKKMFTYHGTTKEPSGEDAKFKIVETVLDDGSKNFEMHMQVPDSDQFFKMMQIHYTKRAEK